MRTVSFKLPAELDDALDELAKKHGVSRSELVRDAIKALAKGKRSSFTAAVDELGLGGDGPADLSTNRKYFANFGK